MFLRGLLYVSSQDWTRHVGKCGMRRELLAMLSCSRRWRKPRPKLSEIVSKMVPRLTLGLSPHDLHKLCLLRVCISRFRARRYLRRSEQRASEVLPKCTPAHTSSLDTLQVRSQDPSQFLDTHDLSCFTTSNQHGAMYWAKDDN